MKEKKQIETITDEELIELFNQAISVQEKLQYFSRIQDYTIQMNLLENISASEKYKFIGKIKSTQGIAMSLNGLDDNNKVQTFNFIAKQFKGNSKGLLEILQSIDFKVVLPENLLVFKLNNLNDMDIDKMIKLQENVDNSSDMKFKVNEKESEDVTYTFPELSAITAKITELTAGIPENVAEADKFYTIYTRIINCITYNHDTISKSDEVHADRDRKLSRSYTGGESVIEVLKSSKQKIDEIRKESAGLYGGLVDGKAICVGYATILHEALKRVGLKSMIVTGTSIEDIESGKIFRSGHAWNQVQIDGEWYNADSTFDASTVQRTGDIACMLRADNRFNPHVKFTRDTKEAHICKKDYPFDRWHFMNIYNQNRWWRGLGGGTKHER